MDDGGWLFADCKVGQPTVRRAVVVLLAVRRRGAGVMMVGQERCRIEVAQ